jgi:gastrin-releasing peptide receptor
VNTDRDLFNYYDNLLDHFQIPVYAALFIFGITGNAILLIIIIRNKDMRTVPNMYILNSAISDMIYLMVHLAESCTSRISPVWVKGDITCHYFPFCYRLSVGLSAYSVAVLSIQRYKVTVNPFHVSVSSQPTWRVTVAIICGVWIVAALFALPSVILRRLCFVCLFHNCEIYYQNVVMFELLVSCVLPLCVIAFSYIMTALHLVKSAQPISEETQSPQMSTRKNTAKIVLGLTVVFLMSYVPYHVLWAYIIFKKYPYFDQHDLYLIDIYKAENRHTFVVSTCLLLINTCRNPVALFCTSLAFRRQFKRYLTCCCKANSTASNIELTRRN